MARIMTNTAYGKTPLLLYVYLICCMRMSECRVPLSDAPMSSPLLQPLIFGVCLCVLYVLVCVLGVLCMCFVRRDVTPFDTSMHNSGGVHVSYPTSLLGTDTTDADKR